MQGYYTTKDDEIRFISKARGKGRSFNLPLHLASSSARGLSDLYFFLKHVANPTHLLVIDEPESHLDTSNQILLARLLAYFVKAGIRVLVTTHSDYLVKEINNLVMLSASFTDKNQLIRSLGYKEEEYIRPAEVKAYIAQNNSLDECVVDELGIDMPVFDQTIDRINSVANELSWRITKD
ncbi:MAG: ATP-binding protein [Proteobacteria bacterium]|nr:ATP-binding protein [Pseudomonadota bacterium]